MTRWGAATGGVLLAVATGLATTGVIGVAAAVAGSAGNPDYTGGATTVFADGRTAFSFAAANLSDAERTRFVVGNSFFRRNWVQAPSSTRARDGLGPHFIARSCGGCHVQDGRGPPPAIVGGVNADQPVALLLRLSVPGRAAHGAPKPEPVYGDQFDNAAVQGVPAEGRVTMRTSAVPGAFSDGTPYVLQAPSYGFADLGYGPMRDDVMVSPRLAPQLIGAGLLEAIPEAEIRRNAQEQARANGPVRGVPNAVWDAFAGRMMIGRFGWKANVATLAHQTGAAFRGDIGITSRRFPDESCTAGQKACLDAPRGGRVGTAGDKEAGKDAGKDAGKGAAVPEIDDETFGQVVFYTATLAPPARRHSGDPIVVRGEKLFHEAQCAICHRPSYRTGPPAPAGDGLPHATGPGSPVGAGPGFEHFTSPALADQVIWPYTDLLLHDMGDALADGRPDFAATGRQWRTPPLWGIGMIHEVNGHQRLLHDGRARGVLEAVLWHGGEALASRDHVLRLPAADRDALVRFVESL